MTISSQLRRFGTLLLVCTFLLLPTCVAAQALAPPVLIEQHAPALPPSLELKETTSVVVELTVDEQGTVKDPSVVTTSGIAALDEAALAAARTLRFAPATRDGVPIAAQIPFKYDFSPPPPPPPLPPPPAPALAITPTPAATSEPVKAIVLDVRGERPPREATNHVITAQEIRTLPGTNGDPLRAVESMPGVARPPGLQGDLIVRGSAPEDTAIFIDGVAIPNAYHFGGLSSVVPAEALDRLDFRPGNFGPEYGRAMGGVVELGLKSPRKAGYSGLLQVDSIDGRFMVQGPLGKRTRFMAAGRRSWLDAWMPLVLDGDDISLKAAPVYWDGQLVLEHDLSKRTTATLFFFGSDDKMELLVKTPDDKDPSESGNIAAHTGFLRVGLRLKTILTDNVSMAHTLSWGPDRTNLQFGIDTFNFTTQQFALRSELRARVHDTLSWAAGLDLQASRYDLRLNVRPYPTTDEAEGPYFARPTRLFVDTIWLFRPAAYALLEWMPLPGVRLIPSVRADYSHDTGNVTLDPRLGMRAMLHDGFYRTTLKAGVGQYSQPPLPQESVAPFGTPGVRSNRAIHASLGLEQTILEGLTVSLEGFYKHFSDLVVARADEGDSAIGARFENTGSGRAYGSELLIKYQGNSRVTGWLAYTLSRSERRASNDEPYHLFQYDQTHILSALGNVRLGWGMSVGGRFRFVSGSPYTPYVGGVLDLDAGAYAPLPGATYSSRLPSFQQLDLRLDKTWQFGEGKLVAYLELRNAYNRKNAEDVSYRYDYARSERVSGLPILPVLGLRGEL